MFISTPAFLLYGSTSLWFYTSISPSPPSSLIQEEQQKRSLEQLLGADRNSLQLEVQRLQAQLQMCSRQSQERLQQLHATLTAAQEEGMQRQQNLRKQGEEQRQRIAPRHTHTH